MREHVHLEGTSLFAGIVALYALKCFLTRMCENVLLEAANLLAGIIALSTFENILP